MAQSMERSLEGANGGGGANGRLCGRIRALKQGYGFLAGDDGFDYFFHKSSLQLRTKKFDDLAERERVEFTPQVSSEQRRRAIEVRILPEES
jgi:cold shock CspA family protein